MIHKLVRIQNVGQYLSVAAPFPGWDGVFQKVNVLFGENGTGKTTLALIFKSLAGNDSLIAHKKRFGAADEPEVLLINEDRKQLKYSGGAWNEYLPIIRVFDVHFIEENLYTGYVSTPHIRRQLFEITVGVRGVSLRSRITELRKQARRLRREHKRLAALARSLEAADKEEAAEELSTEATRLLNEANLLSEERRKLNIELGEYSQQMFGTHAEAINRHLNVFAPGIQIRKFSKDVDRHNVTFALLVNGQRVSLDQTGKGYSVKFVLSEGDRNAIAFAFFLAQLDMEADPSKDIVIFDDPISSFDHARKLLTISYLSRLTRRIDQLFVFSHDIVFARECVEKFGPGSVQLKLVQRGTTSDIIGTDLARETLTGVFKDLTIIEEYLKNGAETEAKKRDVIRCIRPVLEGFLRLKFFREVRPNEWLGDIIKAIRQADSRDPLGRIKPHLDELEDLNDYSKSAHHANPAYQDENISDGELRAMLDKLIQLLAHI